MEISVLKDILLKEAGNIKVDFISEEDFLKFLAEEKSNIFEIELYNGKFSELFYEQKNNFKSFSDIEQFIKNNKPNAILDEIHASITNTFSVHDFSLFVEHSKKEFFREKQKFESIMNILQKELNNGKWEHIRLTSNVKELEVLSIDENNFIVPKYFSIWDVAYNAKQTNVVITFFPSNSGILFNIQMPAKYYKELEWPEN